MARPLARRHAQAIFQLALREGTLEPWRADLQRLAQTLTDSELRHLWDNPRVRLQDKMSLLGQLMDKANPLILNLAGLLMARSRLGLIEDLVAEYGRLVDAHYGIEHAEVATAVPLEDTDQEKLAQSLGQAMGKKVMVTARVDPSILGGLVARIGDHVLDGSVRTRLENLRRSLATK